MSANPEPGTIQIYATLEGKIAVRNGAVEFSLTVETAGQMQMLLASAAAKARGINALLPKMPKGLAPEEQKQWFEERLGP